MKYNVVPVLLPSVMTMTIKPIIKWIDFILLMILIAANKMEIEEYESKGIIDAMNTNLVLE